MDKQNAQLIWASILFVIAAILLAGCSTYTFPPEDDPVVDEIVIQASNLWTELEIPCDPEPIYEHYDYDAGYIGVVGECTETTIGVMYEPGFAPDFGVFTP